MEVVAELPKNCLFKLGMAWTGEVVAVSPIDGADRIQRADVSCGSGGTWTGVVGKDLGVGARVVVFLPDSIVPQHGATAFMEKHGWRVKMMRLRGCPSEVLIVETRPFGLTDPVGVDVTDRLGVLKYEKEVPACISGEVIGAFPSFIPKTDELNFQTVPHFREQLVGHEFYASVKYDGTSQTFFHNDGEFGACSRNWRYAESEKTAVWQLACRHNLVNILPQFGNIALQWECVGPGIQGNPLKLKQVEARLFDVFDIDSREYLGLQELRVIAEATGIELVEVALSGKYIAFSDDELRKMAAGNYPSGRPREGLVFRPESPMRVGSDRLSFKVINLEYKEG